MRQDTETTQQFQDTFRLWQKENGSADGETATIREKAIREFSRIGFPARKTEDWKYTDISAVLKEGFVPVPQQTPGAIDASAFAPMRISDREAVRIVFVDGFFHPGLSELPEVKGLTVRPGLPAQVDGDGFGDEGLWYLNAAFSVDGTEIDVADHTQIEWPVEIYNVTTCPGRKMIQPRHHIRVGKNAEVRFIESYHNLCVGTSFTNIAHRIHVGAGARVRFIKIEHPRRTDTYIVDHTSVEQERDSSFDICTLTLSGALVRNNLSIRLAGENASAQMFGLYVLEKNEHADNRTLVDHAVPNCFSNELYKGILDGKSTGVFNGKIIVRQDAQQTNAYQNNRNILVSEEATINTKPQLEIYADDVKCSHGATSAQIEDSELFYLRARGIGKEKARNLLMYAFAGEVWESIRDEDVRHYIEEQVSHALGMEL